MASDQRGKDEAEHGLGVIFSVADDEGQTKPFAGLALLSQVCAEEHVPGTHVIASQVTATAPQRRVGLRPPCNEDRELLQEEGRLLQDVDDQSPRSVYQYYCREYRTKQNSTIAKQLPAEVGKFALTEIDCNGNFVGDRGVLPLLEVVRLCTGCRAVRFSDNGVKNAGVECIVHMALDHPSLEEVDLSRNRITLGAGKVLQELARRNQNIIKVDVCNTRIDEQLQDRIQARVKANIDHAAQRA